MTEQSPPIDIGSPAGASEATTEDESYFDRYVDDKSKKPPSFIDRAYDTARASYYSGTIFGIGQAKEQAGFSTLYPEEYPERFDYDLKLIQAAKDSTAAAPMTPAQMAQVRNRAYPEAADATEKAADIAGGLVGGAASPETVLLPGVKGLSALKSTSALGSGIAGFAEKYLPGMAYRAVDTGLGQAALMATVNPVIQDGRISAGLQREFDPWELTTAAAGGFVFGAGLHLGVEAGGRLAGKAAQSFAESPVGQSIIEGFERRFAEKAMQRIKEQEPGFRSPMDIVETPPVVDEPAFDARVEVGQSQSVPAPLRGEALTKKIDELASESADALAAGDRELGQALQEVSGLLPGRSFVLPGTDFERETTFDAINKLVEIGRVDAAEALVARWEQRAERPIGKPGVSEDSPKYKQIEANLAKDKRDAEELAAEGRSKLEAAKNKATDAPVEAGQPPSEVVGSVDVMPPAAPSSPVSLPAVNDGAGGTNRLNASEMLSDTQAALDGGSIDAMRFASAPRTEEIDALIELGQKREDAEIDRIFGDDAEKVKRLIRKGRIDQVDDIIYEKFGSYDSPEAKEVNGIIYGTDGYTIVNTESLKSLRDRLSNLEFAVADAVDGDTSQLAKELAWVAPNLPDISAPEASHSESQRIAILSLARAIEDMNASNLDPMPILRETVAYTGLRVGGDESDTALLLERLSQYANKFLVGSEPDSRPVNAASVEATPALPPPAQSDGARRTVYYDDLGEPMYPLTPDSPMSSEDAAALAKMVGRTYAPARPQTLLGFIRGLGGVKDSGGDLRSQNISRRFPGLMNEKTGLPLDRAREAAVEQGYLPEDSTPDDLVQLLLSDEPVYSTRDAGQAEEYNRYQEALRVSREYKQASQTIKEKYPTTHPRIIDDAAMRMAYDNLDVLEAIEAAAESVTIERSPEFEPDDNLTEIFDAWAVQRSPKTNANAKGQGSPPAEPGRRSSEVGAGNAGTGPEGAGGFSYEAGAEGKAQAVIPGAEQISDRTLAERRANQPMRGGNEPAGGMFDEINTAQGDMLSGPEPSRAEQRQIDTPEFRRFFSGSKVTTENGAPKRMYHATQIWERNGKALGDFDVFDRMASVNIVGRSQWLDTIGSWFSDNPGERGAQLYSGGTGAVYPVYLSIKNPLKTSFQWMLDKAKELGPVEKNKRNGEIKAAPEAYERLHNWLIDQGYDGVHIEKGKTGEKEFEDQDVWIALKPEQIKSATGNRGTFDPNNPDIRFRRRGPAYPPEEAVRVAEAQNGIIRSLQQQSFDLAGRLGIPLREGRVQGGRYSLGQFESKFGVARVRQVGDFLTVAHEAGHAIEQQVGADLTNLTNNYALELAKLDPTGDGRVSEGFAEWVAKYIMNPAAATRDAPTFTPRFTDFMRQRAPETMDAIIQASNNYNALLTAPTPIQLGASISSIEPQGWFRDLARSYRESGMSATIGRVLADAYTATLDAYDPLTRATRDMTRFIYEANGKKPVDLKASERPDILMRMNFARSSQGAAFQLRYGVVPYRGVVPDGPSLHDAISVATGQPNFLGKWDGAKVDDFGLFLAIKRAEILIERYNAGDFGERYPLPENWTKANVDNAKAAMLAENPHYEDAAQMVHDFTQQMLKKQFEGGIIDRELYDKLSQTPFYVPMFRDVSDKPLTAGRPGASPDGPGMTDTIRTLRGSSRDIINPLQGIMQQTFLIERTLRHNDVIRSFVDLAARAGAPSGFLVEPVPAREVRAMSFDIKDAVGRAAKENGIPDYDAELLMSSINNIFGEDPLLGTMFKNAPTKKRGEPIVFYKEAGELKAVRLMAGSEGRAVYEAMMTLPTAGKDIALQVMQTAGNIQRAGIVLEPTFFISNYIRDQFAISILRPDYIPFWDGAKGVWSEITQGEAARLYGYFGGQSAGGAVNENVGMAVNATIDDLGRKTLAQQRLKSPLALAEITQVSEAGARNSIFAKVYEQKLAAGLAPYEAAMEAAWAGTDILDFSRHGSKTFIIRQLTPFWNANIQAIDKARRTMLEPLYRAAKGDVLSVQEKQDVANAYLAMFKFAAVGSALGVIWAAINNDDEVYRDADPKRKGTHFVFSAGGKEYDIPKPFELSLGFTLGEQAFAAMKNKDPRAAQNFVTAAYETLVPPVPIAGNPLIKMFYEYGTGVDTYTGRDIIPENMQKFNETPNLQYNERTAPLAVGISKVSKVLADYMNSATGETLGKAKPFSPIMVEHMFGSGFGTVGRDMMAASHWFNPSSDSAPAQFEETVFLRRYIKDPTRTSDAITRYYQHAAGKSGDYITAAASYDDLIKNRRVGDARDLYNGLKADQKAYVLLASAGTDDGKAAFDAQDRRIHPMKRAQDAVQQLHEIARQIRNNTQANSETGQVFALSRSQRKSAIEAIHQLGAQEMRNALVMTDEPGYAGRNILDVNKQYAVIKAISPDLANEVARRYAMASVYKSSLVAKNWPAARKELLRAGSNADISGITGTITDEGYEFGAERISRPRKMRAPMQGQPALQ